MQPTNSILFDRRRISPQIKDLSDKIWKEFPTSWTKGYVSFRKKTTLRCILANLLQGLMQQKCVAISLACSAYTAPRRYGLLHFKYELVRQTIRYLQSLRYLALELGSKDSGLVSVMEASPKLVDQFELLLRRTENLELIRMPWDEVIHLRSSSTYFTKDGKRVKKTGKLIEYKNTREINAMRKRLEIFNDFIRDQDIRCPYPFLNKNLNTSIDCTLVRKFVGDFQSGGRFYCGDHIALGASEKDGTLRLRRNITINGDPIIELDFKCLHISMLYHSMGLEAPQDAYNAFSVPEVLRPTLKRLMLIAANTASKRACLAATATWLDSEPEQMEILEESGYELSELLELLLELHQPIRHLLLKKNCSLQLQNLDSQIAEDVFQSLKEKGVVCLPIHDSFLVPAHYHRELKEQMQNSYKKFCNGKNIGIERK